MTVCLLLYLCCEIQRLTLLIGYSLPIKTHCLLSIIQTYHIGAHGVYIAHRSLRHLYVLVEAYPWHAVPMLTVCDQPMSTLQLMTGTRSLVTGHVHVGYCKKVVLCFMDVLCTSTLKGEVCLYIAI